MMLNRANVSQLSSVQQDAGLRAKRAIGCLQRMRNDRDYSMTEKMPVYLIPGAGSEQLTLYLRSACISAIDEATQTFFTFLRKNLAKGGEAWYYRRAVPRGTQPNTDN